MRKVFNYYNPIYQIEETFFIKNLDYEKDQATKKIQSLQNEIEKLNKYISDVENRIEYCEENNIYFNLIELTRQQNYSDNKIKYYVRVYNCIEESRTKEQIEVKEFTGKERKAAISYAEELKNKYKCEIKRNF